jgi:hypothetical protein
MQNPAQQVSCRFPLDRQSIEIRYHKTRPVFRRTFPKNKKNNAAALG